MGLKVGGWGLITDSTHEVLLAGAVWWHPEGPGWRPAPEGVLEQSYKNLARFKFQLTVSVNPLVVVGW
jgi:hypothetical protein